MESPRCCEGATDTGDLSIGRGRSRLRLGGLVVVSGQVLARFAGGVRLLATVRDCASGLVLGRRGPDLLGSLGLLGRDRLLIGDEVLFVAIEFLDRRPDGFDLLSADVDSMLFTAQRHSEAVELVSDLRFLVGKLDVLRVLCEPLFCDELDFFASSSFEFGFGGLSCLPDTLQFGLVGHVDTRLGLRSC